ncbi:hypothetical protein BY458DRAFT_589759 [Sporodiniella umbellata]|nr:hypothetical protein BY458DRAFT_589759 [Sporodiniella umbellata]
MSFSQSDFMNLNLNIQLDYKVGKDEIGGIWTALNKCKGYLENGQRLEYMSWRLWQYKSLQSASAATAHDAYRHVVSQQGGPSQENQVKEKRVIIVDDDEDYFYSDDEEEEPIMQYQFIKRKPRPATPQRSLLSDLLQREQSPPSLSNSSTSSNHSFDSSCQHAHFHHSMPKEDTLWPEPHSNCW